jgi:LacI family transcriptional regulator
VTRDSGSGLVGVLVPLVHDPYFSAILGGAVEASYEHDVRMILSLTQHEHAREVALLDGMHAICDGTVVILPEESGDELELASEQRHPFVVVDPLLPLSGRIPSVTASHAAGAEEGMRHLLELGHRRIAAITGPAGWLATEERRRGYRGALAEAGIARDPALEVEADFQLEPGAEAAAWLLDRPEPPTAIFAFNDAIALGTLREAAARGMRVPQDLSVLGFDDIHMAAVATPPLTTVRQPLAEMGRAAIAMLLRLVAHEPPTAPHVELATRLVIRGSTAPPRR